MSFSFLKKKVWAGAGVNYNTQLCKQLLAHEIAILYSYATFLLKGCKKHFTYNPCCVIYTKKQMCNTTNQNYIFLTQLHK